MSQGHILVPVERIKELEAGGGSSAATAVDIAIPLLKENWNLENEEYKQIVVVNGLDEDASPIIVLSPVNDEATQEELDAYNCLTNDVIVSDGFITFTAKQLPEISFTVIAKGASATGDAVATVTGLVNKVSELEEEVVKIKSNTALVSVVLADTTTIVSSSNYPDGFNKNNCFISGFWTELEEYNIDYYECPNLTVSLREHHIQFDNRNETYVGWKAYVVLQKLPTN